MGNLIRDIIWTQNTERVSENEKADRGSHGAVDAGLSIAAVAESPAENAIGVRNQKKAFMDLAMKAGINEPIEGVRGYMENPQMTDC